MSDKTTQEPRFSLPDSTPRSSKTELVIGGLRIYIYGLDDLTQKSDVGIAILYLAHNRTRTYRVTEGIAHEVLNRYRNDGRKKKLELIAVTFNERNHGDREISPEANRTWKDGNENHAVDLLSLIDGSAMDFKMVLDYLPAYLTQFNKFYNIMGGVSLGGHVAWRMPALARKKIEAMTIVVGCPNLTSLLLSRLRFDPSFVSSKAEELYTVPYEKLYAAMNETQRRRWPRQLSEIVSAGDRAVDEDFPSDMPLLLQSGLLDPLVPYKHTAPWVGERKGNDKIEFFVQENTGHSCTKEMVAKIAVWISDLLVV